MSAEESVETPRGVDGGVLSILRMTGQKESAMKRQQPKASAAKQRRRQFGGAFGKAPAELQRFLTQDLSKEANEKRNARINQLADDESVDQLRDLMNG